MKPCILVADHDRSRSRIDHRIHRPAQLSELIPFVHRLKTLVPQPDGTIPEEAGNCHLCSTLATNLRESGVRSSNFIFGPQATVDVHRTGGLEKESQLDWDSKNEV